MTRFCLRLVRIGALSALITLALATASHARPSKTFLVAIGNNVGAADEVALRFAERDARAVTRAFQELGGVSGANTVSLLGEKAGAVRSAILRMNERIRAGDPKRSILIVYYSGHADASALHLAGTDLRFKEIRSMVKGSAARVRILIVDSCRSGTVSRVKGTRAGRPVTMALNKALVARGLAILTSSAAGEVSQESDRLRGSFFSHHFVNALRGAADKNRDGNVTLTEAYTYTYQQTVRSSGRTLAVQHPTYRYHIKGRGDLVLTRLANRRRHSGTLLLASAGRYLVFEGREAGPLVAEVTVSKKGASLALPPRRYFVQRRGRTTYRGYRFTLKARSQVRLNALPYRTVAYDRLVRKGGGQRKAIHGLTLMGGGRGEILAGQGVTGHVILGYSLDFPWLTAGLRARFTTSRTTSDDGAMHMRDTEVGLGLVVQRFVDFSWVSVSLGLVLEAVYHHQRFETEGLAPDRQQLSFGFGGLLAFERALWPSMSLRLEGGPLMQLIRKVAADGTSEETTALSWWASGGLVWRF